jgi:hypothetical protein
MMHMDILYNVFTLAVLCMGSFDICTHALALPVDHHQQCSRVGSCVHQPNTPANMMYILPEEVAAPDCSSGGHWPLKKSCKSPKAGIYFDPISQSLHSAGGELGLVERATQRQKRDMSFVHETWNISSEAQSSPACVATVSHAIFMPIAYDEVAYQTEGSNYYVTHMDSLIPLWRVLTKRQKSTPHAPLPEIFLFAFNVEGKIDLLSSAFDDYSKYWIQSLQLLLGDLQVQLGTAAALSRYLRQAGGGGSRRTGGYGEYSQLLGSAGSGGGRGGERGGGGSLCFQDVLWGAPQFNPTPRAVRSFSQDFRRVSSAALFCSALLCHAS